jgi:nucleoside-diphosphate-sugar epimerase
MTGSRRGLLITGATGFVGRYLLERLSTAEVIFWQRDTFGDLLNVDDRVRVLDEANPACVVHLAWARTDARDYDMSSQNADWATASLSFASECVSRGIRFIGMGSALDGQISLHKSTPYSEAKRLLRRESLRLGSGVTWLSPQYIFSMDDARPRLIAALLSDQNPESFRPSFPEERQDFIHVRDVASAMQLVIQHDLRGRVYLGSGKLRSSKQLVEAAYLSMSGQRLPKSISEESSLGPEQPRQLFDLGWYARETDLFFER